MRQTVIRQGAWIIVLLMGLAGCGGGNNVPNVATSLTREAPSAKAQAAAGDQPAAQFNLTKIAERRIARTVFEYQFSVTLVNDGRARAGVFSELQSVGAGTSIVSARAGFGDVPAGASVVSPDLITLRHDRSLPFDLAQLRWQLQERVDAAALNIAGLRIGDEDAGQVKALAGAPFSGVISLLGGAAQTATEDWELSIDSGDGGIAASSKMMSGERRMSAASLANSAGIVWQAGRAYLHIQLGALQQGTQSLTLRVKNKLTGAYADLSTRLQVFAAQEAKTAVVQPGVGGSIIDSAGTVYSFAAKSLKTAATVSLKEPAEAGSGRAQMWIEAHAINQGVEVSIRPAGTAASASAMAVGAGSCVLPTSSAGTYPIKHVWEKYAAYRTKSGARLPATESINLEALAVDTSTAGSTPTVVISSTKEVFGELQSVLPLQSCAAGEAEVVVFVHGFTMEGVASKPVLGGLQGTWSEFPRLAMQPALFGGKQLIPFEFRWGTNTRFDQAAADLERAIELIRSSIGPKRIHIVAHSFGGLVARALFFGNRSERYSEALDLVSDVMTVGTPHSGIRTVEGDVRDDQRVLLGRLPKGNDWSPLDWCNQASCYDAGLQGVRVLSDAELRAVFGRWNAIVGDVMVPDPGAAILQMQQASFRQGRSTVLGKAPGQTWFVGIGLRYSSEPSSAGDHLISYRGQRYRSSTEPAHFELLHESKRPGLCVQPGCIEPSVREFVLGSPGFRGPGFPSLPPPTIEIQGFAHNESLAPIGVVSHDKNAYMFEAAVRPAECNVDSLLMCRHDSVLRFIELVNRVKAEFFDEFDGTSIDPTKWTRVLHPTYSGTSATVAGGELRLAMGAWLHTSGRATFTGRKIVVDGVMGDAEASVLLMDSFDPATFASTGHVMGSDTTYRGWGLDVQGAGRYAIVGPTTAGSITVAEGQNVLINRIHNAAMLYRRLTVDGDVVTFERGISADSIAEKLSTKMASSVVGRPMTLVLGTGVGPYTPGRFQWIRVTVTP